MEEGGKRAPGELDPQRGNDDRHVPAKMDTRNCVPRRPEIAGEFDREQLTGVFMWMMRRWMVWRRWKR